MKVFYSLLIGLAMAGFLSAAQAPQTNLAPQTAQPPKVASTPESTPIPAPSIDMRNARETREIFQQLCAVCSQVLEVALALHDDRDAAYQHADVPSAGLVWWRAELRARQEALRAASRPITFVQALGVAAAVGMGLALLSRAWPWLKQLFMLPDFSTFSVVEWAVAIAFALAIFVIGPLAMYLVLSDD